MLTTWRRRDEAGSGMTIAVAIVFPMLVMIVMVLQFVADSARIEQNLQATANRTAQTASLCCYRTGGAYKVARASIEAAAMASAYNRVRCNNNLVNDSTVVFEDVNGTIVKSFSDTDFRDNAGNYTQADADGGPTVPAGDPVPPAGLVHVYLECSVPPQLLGNFALPIFDTKRTIVGTASIDPYRYRAGA